MSCCSCCCVAPGEKPLKGVRKKKWLVREEEEEEEEEEAESRRIVDVSLLREHYRSSRERQRHTQMLQYRKFSEELSEAISVIPFTPPVITFDPVPLSYNPWQVHLDLHQCSCSDVPVQLPASSLETNTSITGSSSCSSSSSSSGCVRVQESRDRKLSVDSTSKSLSSSGVMSPCSSFNSSREGDYFNTEQPRDPDFRGGPASGSTVDQVQFYITRSLSGPEQSTSDGSRRDPPDDSQESLVSASLTSSDPSSTPVVSVTCSSSSSTTTLHENLKDSQSSHVKTSNGVVQTSSTPVWRVYRKFSAPAPRFTRQLSIGGVSSSLGVHQNQNYYPFPSRKTPKISEAARRLGMYSSF